MGLEGFEGQGLRARLCYRKYLIPYFGYIILPHVDWLAQCLAQRKSQKKYTKRKDRKKDKRRKYFFYTFLYLLGEETNQRYVLWRSVVPKTPDKQNWYCRFDGHCLKEKSNIVSFFKRKILFSFTHASSPFPLETSGSFFKFNSFLFYLFIYFFKSNFFLFIRSLHMSLDKEAKEINTLLMYCLFGLMG